MKWHILSTVCLIAFGALHCKPRGRSAGAQLRGADEGAEASSQYTAGPLCGGSPACDPRRNPEAALAAAFSPLTQLEYDQHDAWVGSELASGGDGASSLSPAEGRGFGPTGMALDEAPLLSAAQRQRLLKERLQEVAARKAQLVKENPRIEIKSYKCSQKLEKHNYSYAAAQAGISKPQILGSANISVVVFFQSIPEASVREYCRAKLASEEVRSWYIHDKETSYANVKTWVNVGDVVYDGPRKHGNDLATAEDFQKIVARGDGEVNFVAQYFQITWFPCTYKGASCWETWYGAANFCRKFNGRLMTVADMQVEADNIVATFVGEGKTVNGDPDRPYLWTTDREYEYGGSTVYPTFNWKTKSKFVRMENKAQVACATR